MDISVFKEYISIHNMTYIFSNEGKYLSRHYRNLTSIGFSKLNISFVTVGISFLVPENWIEVSVLVELGTVRIMTQGDSNLRPLWRDQQP